MHLYLHETYFLISLQLLLCCTSQRVLLKKPDDDDDDDDEDECQLTKPATCRHIHVTYLVLNACLFPLQFRSHNTLSANCSQMKLKYPNNCQLQA